jgi:putative transposase
VEANPVRAGIASEPAQYRWSSAALHLGDREPGPSGALDIAFWERSGGVSTWREMHHAADGDQQLNLLRRCTYAGRPFGEEEFVVQLEDCFKRKWRRWSFEKSVAPG